MYLNEPLFPTPQQQGLMYLMLPALDPRITKTEIKVGWATDRRRQRQRAKAHRQMSPGMDTVAIWPATREYEENFHRRNAHDAMPGKREWYFPTLAIIQAIRYEIRSHDEAGTVTWLNGYTEWRTLARMQELLVAADRVEYLMAQYRGTGTL